MPKEDQASLEPSVFSAIRRYWVLVLVLLLAGGGVGLAVTKVIHKQYEGKATIVIAPLAAPLTPNGITPGAGSVSASATYLNQQATLLQSPSVVDQAAKAVNLQLKLTGKKIITGPQITTGLTLVPQANSSSSSAISGKSSSASSSNFAVQVDLSHPKIAAAAANAIVTAYEQAWKSQIQTLTSASVTSLGVQILSLTAELNTVTSQLTALQERLGFSNTPNAQEQSLTTQQSNLNEQISDLRKTMGQVEVNSQTDLATQLAFVPAVVDPTPIHDSKLRYGGIGLIAGFILGSILVYVLALTRRRFEGRDDPQLFYGVPILGEVPAFSGDMKTLDNHAVALPVLTDVLTLEAEAYRSIATSIRLIRGTDASLAIFITSARAGAGKTTVVANCGLALKEMGERVLLIDADPVKGVLSSTIAADDDRETGGLADVLGGKSLEEATIPIDFGSGQVHLLKPGHKGLALQRWRMEKLAAVIRTACELYDIVLVDGPPLGQLSYAADLAAVVEHTILVVPHREKLASQREVVERLSRTGLVGYVYNRAPRPRRSQRYYYYSGSSLAEMSAPTSNGKATEPVRPNSPT